MISDERIGVEEKELQAKLAQLNKDLAKASEELARASKVSVETEKAAVEASLEAQRAADEAKRMQVDITLIIYLPIIMYYKFTLLHETPYCIPIKFLLSISLYPTTWQYPGH